MKIKRMIDEITVIDVTEENVFEVGIFCIKNKDAPGYKSKIDWFMSNAANGLKIKIAATKKQQLGFIEYVPAEYAWRPIKADNYLFVQCIALFIKTARNKAVGTALLNKCIDDAMREKKFGVCVVTSDGAWMANRRLFEKNSFQKTDTLDRFELLVKKFDQNSPDPKLIDWRKRQSKYQGWNLIYSDQCPWHQKSVTDLKQSALEKGIDLKVTKLNSAQEAQQAPSGFGVFSLLNDGKLLADHYISRTRFENILKHEIKS